MDIFNSPGCNGGCDYGGNNTLIDMISFNFLSIM